MRALYGLAWIRDLFGTEKSEPPLGNAWVADIAETVWGSLEEKREDLIRRESYAASKQDDCSEGEDVDDEDLEFLLQSKYFEKRKDTLLTCLLVLKRFVFSCPLHSLIGLSFSRIEKCIFNVYRIAEALDEILFFFSDVETREKASKNWFLSSLPAKEDVERHGLIQGASSFA